MDLTSDDSMDVCGEKLRGAGRGRNEECCRLEISLPTTSCRQEIIEVLPS